MAELRESPFGEADFIRIRDGIKLATKSVKDIKLAVSAEVPGAAELLDAANDRLKRFQALKRTYFPNKS